MNTNDKLATFNATNLTKIEIDKPNNVYKLTFDTSDGLITYVFSLNKDDVNCIYKLVDKLMSANDYKRIEYN